MESANENSFEALGVGKSILRGLDEMGFTEPTPIQAQAIPVIKSGKDVLGIAQTGTGKTAAYLIPLLMKLVKAEGRDPRALVLVPTRELAIQVGQDLENLSRFTNIRHAVVFGGIGWTKHAELVAPGIDILVATPGRLWDLYRAEALVVKGIRTLVIDEADRMLDMGFMPQLNQLFEVIPVKRQNLLFSATFSERIEEMSHEFLTFPQRVEVAPSATPVEKITQQLYRVQNFRTKVNLVKTLLQDPAFERVILFCRTKENAEQLYAHIQRFVEGEIRILHSNKAQTTRINAIEAFKGGGVRVLISTDVAARGIDVSQVSHVINFDLPLRYEDYVHRIGRTARAQHEGVAITLIGPEEDYHLKNIEALIRMEIEERPLPEEVDVVPLTFDEKQAIDRELDRQRRLADPTFKGAFHEKQSRKAKSSFAFNPKSTKLRDFRKKSNGKRKGR